jgi:pimeloyl-ACP methyl ester carboxylesterase
MHAVARPAIVILHGSNGSGATMRALADAVPDVDTYTPNMLAHGGRPVPERITIEDLANDIIAYMDEQHLARAYVFGYSSGACLALYLARHFPQRFNGVCTLAAKYVFDGNTVAHWTHLTDPERLGRPGNKRAVELTETHKPQDWVAVTNSNRRLFEEYGRNPPLDEDDLRAIKIPALLISSDNDQLVPLAETTALGKLIPDTRVVVYKGHAHPFSIVPIAAMGNVITKWIAQIEARTALDRSLSGMSQTRKPPIVILHGAQGTGAIMKPLADELRDCAEAFTPNMLGHGGREVPESLSIEALAADVLAQMDTAGLRRAYLFGFSSGGLVALYLARHFAERFYGVCTVAAKYVFDQRTVSHWTYMISFERLERPGSKRPQELAKDHAPQDWKKVVSMNRDMFLEFGKKAPLTELDLQAISIPALLFSSNEDQIVPLEETVALGKLIPNSKSVLFHGQCHPFHVVPVPVVAKAICNWISDVEKTIAVSV